jgi:hypothetical protein
LNHEIIKNNKNNKKQVSRVNPLKKAYIFGLWKPKLQQHFVKKTHKTASKQLHEEEENKFRFGSFP